MRSQDRFLTKDFIETREGLLFALIANGTESDRDAIDRVLGTLRYRRTPMGLQKLSTEDALVLLKQEFRQYYFHSTLRDASLAGVPVAKIASHFRPETEIRHHPDSSVRRLARLFEELQDTVGITGSHLIGAATLASDIDLVVYGIENFQRARAIVEAAMSDGEIQELSPEQWRATYDRRRCDALNLDEYLWHETRKRNKFSINGIKVDLSCVAAPHPETLVAGAKLGQHCIRAQVTDDRLSFTSPAVYPIDHESAQFVLVFTATYIGQACQGEMIEAAGILERTVNGTQRLIVGASREATGEYVKVVR